MRKQSIQTLTFLKQLADEAVQQAMQRLAVAMQEVQQAQQQAAQLAEYQQEYLQQWQQLGQQGIKADVYRNFQQFFAQLEAAVNGQNAHIDRLQRLVDDKRQQLQVEQRTQKSYEVLIARAEQQQLLLAGKRDQKLMDEFASRAKRHGN